jgi:hypothetical protein
MPLPENLSQERKKGSPVVRLLAGYFESRCRDGVCSLTKTTAATVRKQRNDSTGTEAKSHPFVPPWFLPKAPCEIWCRMAPARAFPTPRAAALKSKSILSSLAHHCADPLTLFLASTSCFSGHVLDTLGAFLPVDPLQSSLCQIEAINCFCTDLFIPCASSRLSHLSLFRNFNGQQRTCGNLAPDI